MKNKVVIALMVALICSTLLAVGAYFYSQEASSESEIISISAPDIAEAIVEPSEQSSAGTDTKEASEDGTEALSADQEVTSAIIDALEKSIISSDDTYQHGQTRSAAATRIAEGVSALTKLPFQSELTPELEGALNTYWYGTSGLAINIHNFGYGGRLFVSDSDIYAFSYESTAERDLYKIAFLLRDSRGEAKFICDGYYSPKVNMTKVSHFKELFGPTSITPHQE